MDAIESKITDNHETIKKWVEDRYGEPALVEGVIDSKNAAGMLRIHFPDRNNEGLDNISWELFFEIFDENNLAFLYQGMTPEGEKSKFCKIIPKE